MLCADNSSSSDTDNGKNIFSISGKGNTFGINGGLAKPKKKGFVLVLANQRKKLLKLTLQW